MDVLPNCSSAGSITGMHLASGFTGQGSHDAWLSMCGFAAPHPLHRCSTDPIESHITMKYVFGFKFSYLVVVGTP